MPMTLSGNGTITGLVAGGLPDATITGSDLAAGAAASNLAGTNLALNANLSIGNSQDISPDSNSNGHLRIDGNGYAGFITLNQGGMYIGHNSNQRTTALMVDETVRFICDVGGNASIGDGNIRGGFISLGVNDARLLYGGVGAATTAGTLNWNHITNAHSGSGFTLLLGSHANGPGGGNYFHSWCFEYSEKSGSGNMTQWAIGYNSNDRYQRQRYGDVWSSWSAF